MLLFSPINHARLFVAPWTVAARLLCPWDFLGKKTGVGCYFLLQGSSCPRDGTHVSCIGRQILYCGGTWETQNRLLCYERSQYKVNFTIKNKARKDRLA